MFLSVCVVLILIGVNPVLLEEAKSTIFKCVSCKDAAGKCEAGEGEKELCVTADEDCYTMLQEDDTRKLVTRGIIMYFY